uniref:Uncharacterized protein n=1 Tax=Leersia perrieri TaxID=77586 RepID=A0A0D9XXZ2_9ORYZ
MVHIVPLRVLHKLKEFAYVVGEAIGFGWTDRQYLLGPYLCDVSDFYFDRTTHGWIELIKAHLH